MRVSNDELTSVSDRSYKMGYFQALDDLERVLREVENVKEGKEKGTFISAAALLDDIENIKKDLEEKGEPAADDQGNESN